jgi:hypothetical protein
MASSIEDAIHALGLYGEDGDCGLAAIEINEKIFGGSGSYVAALDADLLAEEWFVGHVAVYRAGRYWDAHGALSLGDLLARGGPYAVLVQFDGAEEVRRVHERQWGS